MASRGEQSCPQGGFGGCPGPRSEILSTVGFTQALVRLVRASWGCRGGLSRASQQALRGASWGWVRGQADKFVFSSASARCIGQMGLSSVSDQRIGSPARSMCWMRSSTRSPSSKQSNKVLLSITLRRGRFDWSRGGGEFAQSRRRRGQRVDSTLGAQRACRREARARFRGRRRLGLAL